MQIIPHGYQVRSVEHAIYNPRAALFLDMGLGKTVIVLTAVSNLLQQSMIKGCLVVAPLRVIYNVWPDEKDKWTHTQHLSIHRLHGSSKSKKLGQKADIYTINYEGLFWLFDELRKTPFDQWPFDMIVFDESTAIKNHNTKRFRLLKFFIKRFNRRIILTGTPSPNSLMDLWAQYYLLDDGERLGTSQYYFQHHYFSQDPWKTYKWDPMPDTEIEITKKIRDITIRLDAEDYLAMPQLINNEVKWEMSPRHHKTYRRLEADFIASIQGITVTATNAAALSSKLRQYVSGFVYTQDDGTVNVHNEKIDALTELIDASPGENILCAIQYRHEYDLIRKKYPDTPVVYGGMRQSETSKIIRSWNEGSIPLLVVHPASIAHGVNLQAGGRMLCWFGIPWSLEHYLQLVGRLHRQGQTKPVINHFLVAKKTVEERIVMALQNKESQSESFLESIIKEMRGSTDERKAA